MKNDWKRIWDNRLFDESVLAEEDPLKVFVELKRSNGFDTQGGNISPEELYHQYETTKQTLFAGRDTAGASVYELGCGSGANLYLFERDGFQCGGIDYSPSLIAIAEKVLKSTDITCGDALTCPELPQYDSILSNSVFCYFESVDYALAVLDILLKKTRYSIGLLDIHDISTYDDYIAFRKKTIDDYETKYASLPKLFFDRNVFIRYAEEHDLDIVFTESEVKGYWNNPFIFNCYLYKRS